MSSWRNWALGLYGATMGGPRLSFLAVWAMPAVQAFQPGLSAGAAGAAVSCAYMAMMVCTPPWGFLADYLDRHMAVMFVSACCGAGSLAAVVFMGDRLPPLVIALLFTCIGASLASATLLFTISKMWNDRSISGVASGFVNTWCVGMGSLASPFVGALIDMGWDGRTDD